MCKLNLEKAEEPEIELPTFMGAQEKKKENSRKKKERKKKKSISDSLTTLKPLIVQITTNFGKFFKGWEYQTTLVASCETFMQVNKQQLEPDMEQWTGSKLGKDYVKIVYCHFACLTYMQCTSCKIPGLMKCKLNQDC